MLKPASLAAVIIDKNTGTVLQIVVPDYQEQLNDPAFNPADSTQILIPIEKYKINNLSDLQSIIDAATAQFNSDVQS